MLDTDFPDANRLFTSPARADGSEKWVDFVAAFPHCECVYGLSEKGFTAKYQKWCKKHYNFNWDKALDIYASACGHFSIKPKTDVAKFLVEQAASQLRAVSAAPSALRNEICAPLSLQKGVGGFYRDRCLTVPVRPDGSPQPQNL